MTDWKSCKNCKDKECYDDKAGLFPEIICWKWKPIRCRCGGVLSEERTYHYGGGPIKELAKYDGRAYRHCYACHSEFFYDEQPGI